MQDPEFLELRNEIALVDSRTAELLSRIDIGEAGRHWQSIKDQLEIYHKAIKKYRISVRKQTGEDMAAAFLEIEQAVGEINAIVDNALSDYAVWDEINKEIELRRKLVESDRRRLMESHQMITSERALLMFGILADELKTALAKNVDDPKVIQAVLVSLDSGIDKILEDSLLIPKLPIIDYRP